MLNNQSARWSRHFARGGKLIVVMHLLVLALCLDLDVVRVVCWYKRVAEFLDRATGRIFDMTPACILCKMRSEVA